MKVQQYHIDLWTLHMLQQATQFFTDNQQQAYLVGGSIRNLLLHEPCPDWDIVTTGDFSKLARQLANRLGGFYAYMHARASRITVKHEQQELVIDISPLHGNTIEADLRERDFTINAIASELPDAVQSLTQGNSLNLIDPLNGQADIQARILRAVSDDIFKRDPLRMLRAVRFMMRYHLTIESKTEKMLVRDAPTLLKAAPERIHDEFYAILSPTGASDRLRFLDSHGLLTVLMPEFIPARGMPQPSLHHWDVLDHSLQSPAALERLTTTLHQSPEEVQRSPLAHGQNDLLELQQLLQEADQQGVFKLATMTSPPMKLATLLHDIGKTVTYVVNGDGHITFYHHPQAGVPLAQQIMKRLNLSTNDRRLVQQVVAHHMRPGLLSAEKVTDRAIRRYFVDLGPTGINVALVSLADHLAMRGPDELTESWDRHLSTVRLLLTRYIRERERILPPRLIQAEELMRRLNLQPGPLVGKLLEYIAEAQAEGRVHSKEDALWVAQEQLQQSQPHPEG
ncbi:MAG TPA: HD domain-containing protein, partial [Ktedonobacteraceae bacterium]|nr:HD domain-containing protein [Ktedonobacteraceae bacterium]